MNLPQLKQIAPVLFAGAATFVLGLSVHFFAQAGNAYLLQKDRFDLMQARVRLATSQKNELIQKQRILDQTVRFVQQAETAGLSPAKWTVYDVNLQEEVGFDKADQILTQCTTSQVAYFYPITLTLKTIPKQSQAKGSAEPAAKGDLLLSVHGKFMARKP